MIIRYGLEIAQMVQGQVSTALRIPKSLLYYSVVLGGIGILLQAGISILLSVTEFFGKKEGAEP